MNTEHAQIIFDNSPNYAEDDQDVINLREDYSGRGMFGEQTTALTGNPIFIHRIASSMLDDIIDSFEDDELVDDMVVQELKAIQSLITSREDSMGLGSVFY